MKPRTRHLLGFLALTAGLMLAVHFWPGTAPVGTLTPAHKRGYTPTATAGNRNTAIPAGTTGPRERDLVIPEAALNAGGLVSIDERLVPEFRLPLLASNRRDLAPLAIAVLDLSRAESAAVAEAFAEAGRSLQEELNARARVGPVKDGVRIAYRLEPEKISAREQELRARITAALDDNSRRYLQKIADGSLVAALLPVPLEDITVTVTRNEKAEYRAEMTGRDATGSTITTWWVARADAVLNQFYGPQAREQLPLLNDDLAAIAASRRGGTRGAR